MAAGNQAAPSATSAVTTEFTPANLSETQTVSIKRVSFDEQQVRTFVYDKDTNDGSSDLSHIKLPFTDPDAPPSRITVVAEESEMPTTIMPPAQIEDNHQNITTISSPPLPALIKRVENELTENPFRPEESLFHEVDPIVEAYKRKPYPPSLPGSLNTTPVKTTNQAYLNGISPSSLVADKEMERPLTSSTPLMNNDERMDAMEDGMGDLPKARQVECVHIEKKKKRKSMKGLLLTN